MKYQKVGDIKKAQNLKPTHPTKTQYLPKAFLIVLLILFQLTRWFSQAFEVISASLMRPSSHWHVGFTCGLIRPVYTTTTKKKKNVNSIIFSQQILSGKWLLLVIIDRQKSNLNCKFKFKLITTYHMWLLWKYYERNTFRLIWFKNICFWLIMTKLTFY